MQIIRTAGFVAREKLRFGDLVTIDPDGMARRASHFCHVIYGETQQQRFARLSPVIRRRKDGQPDMRFADGRFVERFEREGPTGIFA